MRREVILEEGDDKKSMTIRSEGKDNRKEGEGEEFRMKD